MKFRKGSAYHLVSECNQYCVTKVIVNGKVQYEAWFTAQPGAPLALANRNDSSLDCIGICRRHAESRLKKTA